MIENSQIYHWGGDGDGWWQKVADPADISSSDLISPLPSTSNFTFSIEFGGVNHAEKVNDSIQSVISLLQENQLDVSIEDSNSHGVTSIIINDLAITQDITVQFELSTPESFDWSQFDVLELATSVDVQTDESDTSRSGNPEWGIDGDGPW